MPPVNYKLWLVFRMQTQARFIDRRASGRLRKAEVGVQPGSLPVGTWSSDRIDIPSGSPVEPAAVMSVSRPAQSGNTRRINNATQHDRAGRPRRPPVGASPRVRRRDAGEIREARDHDGDVRVFDLAPRPRRAARNARVHALPRADRSRSVQRTAPLSLPVSYTHLTLPTKR